MRNKILAVVLSCLTLLTLIASSVGGTIRASAVSVEEMTQTAVELITRSEGTYGSVNRNDNGAVSIGILQWHANRALDLMRSIANADTASAQSILGSTFYNEVMSASSWNTRTFSVSEGSAAEALLTTSIGKSKQDALAYSDVQGYIAAGQSLGITNAGVLVYYAELYNRGSGVAARILSAAKGSGSYADVTVTALHNAAMSDRSNSAGYYTSRLNDAYNTVTAMGWGDASASASGSGSGSSGTAADTSDFSESYAGTYTVTASSLNFRSGPSTSASKIGTIPNGASVTVTSGNGSWAAVTYNGTSGYCSMDYLQISAASTTAPAETTAAETTTAAALDFSESCAGTYRVTATSLNFRSSPSTSASKLGTIANGTLVTVTSGNGSWAAVTYNGTEGYCSMDYLELQEAAATTAAEPDDAETTTTTETTAAADPETDAPQETTTEAADLSVETEPAATTEPVSNGLVGSVNADYASLYGDINCDGVVDSADAVLLQKYLNGTIQLNVEQLSNADCQRDAILNTTDVIVIMQYLVRNLTALPIV